jgi:hypothetical protein
MNRYFPIGLVLAFCILALGANASFRESLAQEGTPPAGEEHDPKVFANLAGELGFDPNVLEMHIHVFARGLLHRADNAERDAIATLEPLLAPYNNCEIGLGLISGGGTGQESIDTASLVAQLLILEFPDLSSDAQFLRSSMNDPAAVDEVRLVLFFLEGCTPTPGAATPVPSASPATATP